MEGKPLSDLVVLIKGGGEMASGVAHRLARSHFKVCITEIAQPQSVRREVSFCEAVYDGAKEVEGVVARSVQTPEAIKHVWQEGQIPILVDPAAQIRAYLRPDVVVDAILAKKNLGTRMDDAPLVIGLGPGFTVGRDAHLVIETNRGHNLGRVLTSGEAEPNTGTPAPIEGYTHQRVLRAPVSGRFFSPLRIGDSAQKGEIVATVDSHAVKAEIDGIIRGLIRNEIVVEKGWKLGDVDPRASREACFTVSDKAHAIAGGVLEGILMYFNR
ncbi:MAG: EF2563 family selenium-dependent molybdenum hydroxylase system protein [Chloroflexi bacterium]|nr:EF2563 family selenium-dependent molybdenum hydroxylase system protein [Chloroflexota bacterium]